MIDYQKLINNVPDELKKLPNWVGCKIVPSKDRPGKTDKIPMNALTGECAKSNDPSTWTDFENALDLSIQRNYDAIGLVFQPPYVGVDLDNCVKNGIIASHTIEILKRLGSYSELSPSGTGVHVICKGEISRAIKKSKIEIYTNGRFFTFTGNRLEEYPAVIEEQSEGLNKLIEENSSKPKTKKQKKKPRSVEEILEAIAQSKDADKFNQLFSGEWEGHYSSQSEADLALCGKLAFWTGRNPALMDSIFRQSKLFREKWDTKHYADGRTYGQGVIDEAVSGCDEVFTPTKQKVSQGEIITKECEEIIKDTFRDQQGSFYVVLPIDKHSEVCQTKSTRFRNWIAKGYRARHKTPPNSESINQAIIQLEAKCEDSRQIELFNRVGHYGGAIYFDLTTPDWRGVRITPNGWEIIYLPPIFRRYSHQNEQVMPVLGGDPKDILRFCNLNEDDQCLFIVTTATYFIPNIPHVIVSQNGEQGSGKSYNSRAIKRLVDPSKVELISSPKDLEQAQMTADKHWVSAFDNLSKIIEWFSDFLCRGVTGEGDMKRSLYTNDDEFIRSYRRCFVINGIGSLMWRPDLLDRSILFDIPILKDGRSEGQINEEWKNALPGILGGFFTAISKAMNHVNSVTGHEKFRMADYVRWGMALADELGFSRQEFLSNYKESVDHKWENTAEESPLVRRLTTLVMTNNGEWSGSAAELLAIITPEGTKDKTIPNTPRWLSSELMRIAPVMRSTGIDVIRLPKREAGTGRRLFVLRKIDKKACEVDCEQGVSNGDEDESTHSLFEKRPF